MWKHPLVRHYKHITTKLAIDFKWYTRWVLYPAKSRPSVSAPVFYWAHIVSLSGAMSGGRIERWQPDHQMSGQSMYMFILNQAFNTLLFYYCCSIKQWKQFRALPPNKLHKFHKCHKKINIFLWKKKKKTKKFFNWHDRFLFTRKMY